MTREEALKELAEWREQMKNHGVPDYGKKLMALDMAIEALTNADPNADQHVQHVGCVDLISRQDAFRTYQVKVCHGVACSECQIIEADGTCRIEAWLKDIPSADRPTGHIVTKCNGEFRPTVWAECSECGEPIDPWDKFCRHCGARMKGNANRR